MTKNQLPDQGGYLVLPKSLGFSCVIAVVVWLLGATWFGASELTGIKGRVAELEKSDTRFDTLMSARIKLADERYESLRGRDDRITRLEEQQKVTNELLRDIRTQLMRKDP